MVTNAKSRRKIPQGERIIGADDVAELLQLAGAPQHRTGVGSCSHVAEMMELIRDLRMNPRVEAMRYSTVAERGKRAADELARVLPDILAWMRQQGPAIGTALLLDSDPRVAVEKHAANIATLMALQEILDRAKPGIIVPNLDVFDRARVIPMVWELYGFIVGNAGRSASSPAVRFVVLALARMGFPAIREASVAQALRRKKLRTTS